MSKEPQVGDVWKIMGYKAHITKVKPYSRIEVLETDCSGYLEHREFIWDWLQHDEIEYLGKSKANIDDLFKTENEE